MCDAYPLERLLPDPRAMPGLMTFFDHLLEKAPTVNLKRRPSENVISLN